MLVVALVRERDVCVVPALALAAEHGLRGQLMDDWEKLPHNQSKIRLTRA